MNEALDRQQHIRRLFEQGVIFDTRIIRAIINRYPNTSEKEIRTDLRKICRQLVGKRD
jgi:hypothetical protein